MNDVDLSEWAYCGEIEGEGGKTMIRDKLSEHWLTGVVVACSFAFVVVMIARALHG